ncbi:hypothetical protein [Tenacibaculum finnmarkense]|uniref:Nucleotide modification associated domain-containing protein n=2 Tax=Tenacibaculum finnmarkense TaxID=2781243 RepID=A0AAP1WGR6_9FLAO|nr:hypothetical protein [Tenacibaculum finnmarkense]MBE7653362.1 hypothetical protein [Tenacibaculum finnmarkense genomovar finnmarkense]MBE7660359.1 hypothetical protein [Tenacibaculum finnmarkense genomovar finnmarkense]MBE7695662.1 hypothetical protein [Tenacibaculum finnmarkense genomovar finnmarkense]MCD8427677.1 hypothetical protein [Tenacibaculum finnmarkense genomovar finnmarkense]MCG8252033.1 hypothetical protein [Tenacibaculum finnmarkense genomovar finnmarkense]
MEFFSYVIKHDLGLAPNPFWNYCTLAVCKPNIRKNRNLNIGDWIIGTGSEKMGKLNHFIYAMQLTEKMTFEEYWMDSRFTFKKPILNGSLMQMYGDNFYHKNNDSDDWIQEKSAHSVVDKEKHKKRDTSANTVLISSNFYYLGDSSILIPDEFRKLCKKKQGMKYKGLSEIGIQFMDWIQNQKKIKKGISGDPINWNQYKQMKLEF